MKNLTVHELLKYLSQIDYIHPDDIPDIDLYMDQVITLMDRYLSSTKRHPDDKLITKTMINNYVKDGLLPPPKKKKYTKEHVLTLAFIYYFKNILSISDIKKLLKPMIDEYFDGNGNLQPEEFYRAIFDMKYPFVHDLSKDLMKKYKLSEETVESFGDLGEKEEEYLGKFTFICTLAADIYLKKLIIEYIIDTMDDGKEEKR